MRQISFLLLLFTFQMVSSQTAHWDPDSGYLIWGQGGDEHHVRERENSERGEDGRRERGREDNRRERGRENNRREKVHEKYVGRGRQQNSDLDPWHSYWRPQDDDNHNFFSPRKGRASNPDSRRGTEDDVGRTKSERERIQSELEGEEQLFYSRREREYDIGHKELERKRGHKGHHSQAHTKHRIDDLSQWGITYHGADRDKREEKKHDSASKESSVSSPEKSSELPLLLIVGLPSFGFFSILVYFWRSQKSTLQVSLLEVDEV